MNSYIISLSDKEYIVEICSIGNDSAEVSINGDRCTVGFRKCVDTKEDSSINTKVNTLITNQENKKVIVASPLPGVVVSIKVESGEAVVKGQTIAVVEAMKMENEIVSEYSGTVSFIHVHEGDSILEGAPIATIG